MATTSAQRRSEDGAPLQIDLYGEAKQTAEWIADRTGVTPGDVVARALGILYSYFWKRTQRGELLLRTQTVASAGNYR